ncbi:FMN-binding protein [Myxococcota bacterium]|nr:FMN-binding protein [Myxococcota bacterium]
MSAPSPALAMTRTLVGAGVVCGFLIVVAYELTAPIIQENRIEARQAAVFEVLPGAVATATFQLQADGSLQAVPDETTAGDLVFAGYDAQGGLVGAALEAQGMGYQDTIRLIYGYSFDKDAIIGIKVLESRETPGLGTRVETDPVYQANFDALDVSLDAAGQALANPIEAVGAGKKQHPWQVDCITGATISSKAIANMLGTSAAKWMPAIAARPEALARPEGAHVQ